MPPAKTNPFDLVAAALDALDVNDLNAAQSQLQQLEILAPSSPEFLHLVASLFDRQGKSGGPWRRRAIIQAALDDAARLQSAGRSDEARSRREGVLALDPYNAQVCDALGAANQRQAPPDPEETRFGRPSLNYYETPIGNYFLPSGAPNDIIIRRMKAGQVFEREVVEALAPSITPGSTVLDVGANLGQMSLLFSELAGPDGSVHAFEADDYIHWVLNKNIAANGRTTIKTYQAAVYDSCGSTVFYPEQDFQRFESYGSYGIDPKASSGREVTTLTIDSLDIKTPISLIKVDIQGSDLFALRGARRTIETHRPTVIFEFEEQFQSAFGTSLDDYLRFVEEIGYRVDQKINGINYLIKPR